MISLRLILWFWVVSPHPLNFPLVLPHLRFTLPHPPPPQVHQSLSPQLVIIHPLIIITSHNRQLSSSHFTSVGNHPSPHVTSQGHQPSLPLLVIILLMSLHRVACPLCLISPQLVIILPLVSPLRVVSLCRLTLPHLVIISFLLLLLRVVSFCHLIYSRVISLLLVALLVVVLIFLHQTLPAHASLLVLNLVLQVPLGTILFPILIIMMITVREGDMTSTTDLIFQDDWSNYRLFS